MSHVISFPVVENAKPGFMQFSMRVMFHQGLWYEDPEPDPSKDLVLYGQRLSRLITRYPRIRVILRKIRSYYPWFLVGQMVCQIVFFHLIWILYNWGNKEEIAKSCCDSTANAVICAMMLGFLRHKEKLEPLIENLIELSKIDQLDDDEQKHMVEGTQATCDKFTKLILGVFSLGYIMPTLNLVFVEMIPQRKMFDKAYYPYDETSSPAYEITILTQFTLTTSLIFAIVTLVIFSYTLMINVNVQWKVLIKKLRNIRSISKRKIKNHRVVKLDPITEQADCLHSWIVQGHTCDVGRTDALDPADVHYGYDLPGCVPRLTEGGDQVEGSTLRSISESIEHSNVAEPDISGLAPAQGLQTTEDVQEIQRAYNSEQSADDSVPDDEEITSDELDMEMQFQLTQHIKRHGKLLRTSRDLNVLFNEWFIVVFGAYTILYAMLLWITLHESLANILITVAVVAMFSSIYLCYAHLANDATDKAAEVSQALYECDWLTSSASFKRKMLIVMTAANQTVEFKPRGLDALSLKMFGRVR